MANNNEVNSATTFEFPIRDPLGELYMKNIPHSTLLNFYGMIVDSLNSFLFEFIVLYHNYDYTSDWQKLKNFPATLKGVAL